MLAAGALVAYLLVRRRHKHTWEERLATEREEVFWFATDLLPLLRRAGSSAEATGAWSVASPRVAALEDQLSTLIASAPGEEPKARATSLRDAVRQAREDISGLAHGAHTNWETRLYDVQTALLTALDPQPHNGPQPGTLAP